MVKMKEFTRQDYYGMGGVEKFSTGQEPMIGRIAISDGDDVVVIADKNGFTLFNGDTKVKLSFPGFYKLHDVMSKDELEIIIHLDEDEQEKSAAEPMLGDWGIVVQRHR